MKRSFPWWWALPVGALCALSVSASANYGLAVLLAAAAVLFAAVGVADTIQRLVQAETPGVLTRPLPVSPVREWLAAGELGREDVLLLLDRLERLSLTPGLPARTPQEISSIVDLQPKAFQEYVKERLATLEATV